jgi:predicted transcriptional regulator
MSRKRSNLEISADILRVALHGARKSHIVYQANLNFSIIKDYLKELTSSGLLQCSGPRGNLYTTTEKGVAFINYFDGLQQFTMQISSRQV